MTRPRQHPSAKAYVQQVTLAAGVRVPIGTYNNMVDAYAADHPEFTPPRPGIRGNASRLGLPGLPDQWWTPYLHLSQDAADSGTAE